MNKQRQWLFESPFVSSTTYYTNSYANREYYSNLELADECRTRTSDCPPSGVPVETVSGYITHATKVPEGEKKKIKAVADSIVRSVSLGSPSIRVCIVGHADQDWRENEIDISSQRAVEVMNELTRAISNPSILSKINWKLVCAGKDNLLVPPNKPLAQRVRNRRVEIFVATTPPPPPPPSFNWREATKRGLELLKKQPLPARQTKRLQCLLQKLLEPNIIDAYLLYDYNVRQQVACVSAELTIKLLQNLKVDLARGGVFSPEVSDSQFIKNLATIDYNIVEGIRKIDEHLKVNGIATHCFKRRMNQWIAASQQNPKSIYWCYGTGQP
jgi:hypothetical protein